MATEQARPSTRLARFVEARVRFELEASASPADITPTLYAGEGEELVQTCAIARGKGGAPVQPDRLKEMLQDLAIDPDIDVYCAVLSGVIGTSNGSPRFGLRLHYGERDATGRMTEGFAEVRQVDVLSSVMFARRVLLRISEPSWFIEARA